MKYLPILAVFIAFVLCGSLSAKAQSITVNVHKVVSEHPVNPIGFCGNFLNDSDRAGERKRSMVRVLRDTGGGTYRWPAGTIAENYLWHPPGAYTNAVSGLRPRPVSRQKFSWKHRLAEDGSFADSMNFDEFVATCKQAKAEPIVMVSSYGWKLPGSSVTRAQLITSAQEWVRYANITRDYGVTYWEIGNEVDLAKCPLSLEEYLEYFGDVTAAMKRVDPDIKVGLGLLRGSADEYYKGVFERFPDRVDFCVAHQYHTYLKNYPQYQRHDGNYINSIDAALKNIDRFAPAARAPQVELLVTEFSAFSPQRRWVDTEPSVYKALLTFEMMGNALTRDSRVRSMNFWITHSPWSREITDASALNADNTPTAMGKVVELMGRNLKTQMVETSQVAVDPRTYATFDPKDGALTIFLLNKSDAARRVTVTLKGLDGPRKNTVTVFQGEPNATSNTYKITKNALAVELRAGEFERVLPPGSITVVAFDGGRK